MDLTSFKSVCVFIFDVVSKFLNFHLPFYLDVVGTRLYMTPLSIISGVLVIRLIIYIFKSIFGFGMSQVYLDVRTNSPARAYRAKSVAAAKKQSQKSSAVKTKSQKSGGVKQNGK